MRGFEVLFSLQYKLTLVFWCPWPLFLSYFSQKYKFAVNWLHTKVSSKSGCALLIFPNAGKRDHLNYQFNDLYLKERRVFRTPCTYFPGSRMWACVLTCFSHVWLFVTLCSPPGSHGILQARILEWGAVTSSGDLLDPGIKSSSPCLLHWQRVLYH